MHWSEIDRLLQHYKYLSRYKYLDQSYFVNALSAKNMNKL